MYKQEFVHVFIERGDKGILLQHRDDKLGIYEPGQLGIFGGHIDAKDVSPEAAGIRELEEETGLAFNQLHFLGRMTFEGLDPNNNPVEKEVHAFSVITDPEQEVPIYEGQRGIVVYFNQVLPVTPRLTRIAHAELMAYYSGKFPDIDSYEAAT